jgi:histone H4
MSGKAKILLGKRHTQEASAIESITRPAIRRLARRGGIKRISGLVYTRAREVVEKFLQKILKDTLDISEFARRKTISATDVVYALSRHGHTLYGFGV